MADMARGKAECCIMPQDHSPSAINHVKHAQITNTLLLHVENTEIKVLAVTLMLPTN